MNPDDTQVRVAMLERAFIELFAELRMSGQISAEQTGDIIARIAKQCRSQSEVDWTGTWAHMLASGPTLDAWYQERRIQEGRLPEGQG